MKRFQRYLCLAINIIVHMTYDVVSAIAEEVSRRLPTDGGPGSISGQFMWDLWWTKWHWDRPSSSTYVTRANPQSTNSSASINHPMQSRE
jgi:hypothetical protein